MGYTTDFDGQFGLNEPLTPAQIDYLTAFNESRRMKRNAAETSKRSDPKRLAVGLPVGPDGAYFVGEDGFMGQDNGEDVIDHNRPPQDQPGLWCQWIPTEDGSDIEWDQGEKFYDYVEWLRYIIDNFFVPWNRVLNGEVEWQGEDSDDRGMIVVQNNVVTTKQGKVVYQ